MSKRALVTGASSGIGLEFARILARGGYDLFIVARDKKALKEVADELNTRYETEVETLAVDLSRPNSADKVYTAATASGNIDVLINNAGFADFSSFVDAKWEKLHNMINLNVLSLTYLTKLTAKDMTERGHGMILNMGSTASYTPGPLMAVYHATKSYVASFSVSLSQELKKTGVTVTLLNPGVTRTNFQMTAEMEDRKFVSKRDRMATAYEVALAGYEGMINGKTVVIPGFTNKLVAGFSSVAPQKVNAVFIHSVYKRST